VLGFGPGVGIRLRRNGKKFGIVQVTAQRFDVGIKLKGVEPADRYTLAGSWNTMVTHGARIKKPEHVDAGLFRWLRNTHENA